MATKRSRKDLDGSNDENSINRLPDALLCHVLSFLPTEYAVQTCILSRRWRYLWALVPNLCSDDLVSFTRLGDKFCRFKNANFVDRVLILHRMRCLKKFSIKAPILTHEAMCTLGYDATQVNMWICVAVSRNVEELDLYLQQRYSQPAYCLPNTLFTLEKLSVLKLHGHITFPSLDYVLLPNLKICHFRSVSFLTNKCLALMLSGSLVLEELVVHLIWCGENMNELQIRSSSLKSLSIRRANNSDKRNVLVIDTPKLEFLELVDCISDDFQVSNLPLLVKANVDLNRDLWYMTTRDQYAIAVYQLLRQIAAMKDLCLSGNTYSIFCNTLAGHMDKPIFRNLTRLELRHGIVITSMLSHILKCSPILEIIIFYKLHHDVEQDLQAIIPECSFSSLKVIEFRKFLARPFEMEMIEYWLKNAMLLKKMIICFDNADEFCSDELRICQQIFKFTRGSEECQVSVLPGNSSQKLQ